MNVRMTVLAPVNGDPRIQEFALKLLIITTVGMRGRIKDVLHIENHKAILRVGRKG